MSNKKTHDITTYQREYYENNKESLQEMLLCDDCGLQYRKCKKSAHMKTKKHISKMLEYENNLLKNSEKIDEKMKILEKKEMEIKNMKKELIKKVQQEQKILLKKIESNI